MRDINQAWLRSYAGEFPNIASTIVCERGGGQEEGKGEGGGAGEGERRREEKRKERCRRRKFFSCSLFSFRLRYCWEEIIFATSGAKIANNTDTSRK